jgi:CBS domain-containing protein
MKVKDCKINDDFVSCDIGDNVFKISQMMKQNKRFNHAIVLDGKVPVGVISIRDIVDRVVAEQRNTMEATAKEIMTSPVVTIKSSESLTEVGRMMTTRNFLSLPVVNDDNELLGVISIYDIIEKLKDTKE